MNKLYTWNTPNGQKPAILLEELSINYELVPINITTGEQFNPEFISINPNSKIPAYESGDGLVIFESGAILQHLAETHREFLAETGQQRITTLSWCYWQVGGLGPMIGQWGHFANADEKLPYAIERYLNESIRLYDVLDTRLKREPFLAGDAYSIADMMSFPWAKSGLEYLKRSVGDDLPQWSHVNRWINDIKTRPAVITAMERLTSLTN